MALCKVNQPAADSVWHLFNNVKDRLDRATEDRIALARVADRFKVDSSLYAEREQCPTPGQSAVLPEM